MAVESVLSVALLVGFVVTGISAFRAWWRRMHEGGARS